MPLLTITEPVPGYQHVVLDNPPLNLFDPDLVAELNTALTAWEAGEAVKVVVFESANPDFFMAHVDLIRADQFDRNPQPVTGLALWPDIAVRLEAAPFLTVCSIRGRARGVGSEFALACDLRFASREQAILCHPEVGFGFIPGGGGSERLALNTGRARALEIIIGAQDFDADTAAAYGWINRALPDTDLDAFVDALARRVAGFDRAAIAAAKHTLNSHGGLPEIAWFTATEDRFYQLLADPAVQARVAGFLGAGMQQPGEFELHLANAITNAKES